MNERLRPQPPGWVRAALWICLILLFFPLFLLLFSSFIDHRADGTSVWTLRWYHEVINDDLLWIALVRSLFIATTSALASTLLGGIGALVLLKWRPRRIGPALQWLSSLSLSLPELVLALSLLSWFVALGLSLSPLTVIIAHVTLTLPFAIMVISARIRALDPSYDDAARDLGASEWDVFLRVNLPLLKPALVNGFLLCFLLSFDDFLVTFFTNGAGDDTLPVALYAKMKTGLTPKLHALSTIGLVISSSLAALFALRLRARQISASQSETNHSAD